MTVALSIRQPWASLIVHGHKTIENRTWSTKRRGRILIHAGLRFDQEGWDHLFTRREELEIELPRPSWFPRGGIIGSAELVDCVTEHDSPWFDGPFGFVLENVTHHELVPCKGRLGFFRPSIFLESAPLQQL